MVYKTKLTIPEFVETLNGRALLEIRFPDMMGYHINEVPWHQFAVAGEGKFTRKQVFTSLRDHHYYFKFGKGMISPGMKSCVIRGVFQDPTKVPEFVGKTETELLPKACGEACSV